ncbi:MAG: DNA recombination protein RmuC [Bacteroidales bacterium]
MTAGYIILSALIAGITAWLAARQSMLKKLHEKNSEIRLLADRELRLVARSSELETEVASERLKAEESNVKLAGMEADYRNVNEKLLTQKTEIAEMQQRLTSEFKVLANEILKQHAAEFTQSNQKNIGEILNPLKEKIKDFEEKVQKAYEQEGRDKTSLKTEILHLLELNKRLSEDAENLTKALKGDVKKQGNWGEMVLERVLERSGLIKGENYLREYTAVNRHGEAIRPDVVIKLPDNKHIIVDAKVSLLAYEAYVSADDHGIKDKFLRQHIDALRSQIKILSEKDYQGSEMFDTPDFVLLFMPMESAFSLALQNDPELFGFAWDRKIVIVSPTTLLATLMTISAIWKQEKQTLNALEIARQGGALYDKFVAFIADLEKMGTQMKQLESTYSEAKNKLTEGRGNLVVRAESLRKLGAKVSKVIPDNFLNQSSETSDDLVDNS